MSRAKSRSRAAPSWPRDAHLLAAKSARNHEFYTQWADMTNLMAYGVGGYRFIDFTRLGFPLTTATVIVTPSAVPFASSLR